MRNGVFIFGEILKENGALSRRKEIQTLNTGELNNVNAEKMDNASER